jgi:hypothetical protein
MSTDLYRATACSLIAATHASKIEASFSTASLDHMRHIRDLPLRCPCCGFKTLSARGGYEICAVCFWEDDGQDDDDADEVLGGPNGDLSLTKGRANYRAFGASRKQDLPHVRAPLPEEVPNVV